MNHIGDTNKMVSDTPRVDSDNRLYPRPEYAQEIEFEEGSRHVVISPEAYEELYGIARTLERELAEANKTNRLQYELITTAEKRGVDKSKEELNAAKDRIKRLEEALHRIANTDYRGNRSTESQIAFEALKEAKP